MKFIKLIKTKYFGPTNTRGARIKACSDCGKTITIGWDYSLDQKHNALNAAESLIEKEKLAVEITGIGSFESEYFITIKFKERN